MRFRVGILDVTAALIVLVVMLLPARSVKVRSAYADEGGELVREIALAQARLATDPQDGEAAYAMVKHLLRAGQTDWALRVAGNAAQLEGRGSWRALLAISATHAQRIEIEDAARFAERALEACQAGPDCPPYEEVRLQLYNQQLAAGVRAIEQGLDPRSQPAEFYEALQVGLRAVRIESGGPAPSPSE